MSGRWGVEETEGRGIPPPLGLDMTDCYPGAVSAGSPVALEDRTRGEEARSERDEVKDEGQRERRDGEAPASNSRVCSVLFLASNSLQLEYALTGYKRSSYSLEHALASARGMTPSPSSRRQPPQQHVNSQPNSPTTPTHAHSHAYESFADLVGNEPPTSPLASSPRRAHFFGGGSNGNGASRSSPVHNNGGRRWPSISLPSAPASPSPTQQRRGHTARSPNPHKGDVDHGAFGHESSFGDDDEGEEEEARRLVEAGAAKEDLSTKDMLLLTVGLAGAQLTWTVEMAYVRALRLYRMMCTDLAWPSTASELRISSRSASPSSRLRSFGSLGLSVAC
jgi:hypothetical protein